MLPRVFHGRQRTGYGDRAGPDERRDAAAVVERHLDRTAFTLVLREALARHGDIAVDRDRIIARTPDGDECAAAQRANTWLCIDRHERRRQRTVDRVAAEPGDFPRGIGCALRGGCNGDAGHGSVMDDRANALALVHEVECAVNVVERHRIGDELIDLDVAVQVLVDHAG